MILRRWKIFIGKLFYDYDLQVDYLYLYEANGIKARKKTF